MVMGTTFDRTTVKRAVIGAFVMFAGSTLAACSGGGGGSAAPVTPSNVAPPPSGGGSASSGNGGGTGTTPTQSTLKVVEYPLPSTSSSAAAYITAGPDGNMWFGEGIFAKVGRISPSGAVSEFAVAKLANGTTPYPTEIVTGADGNLYTAAGAGAYQVKPDGTFTALSGFGSADALGITVGPDHNLWITDPTNTQLLVANSAGVVATYAVPIVHTSTTFQPDLGDITSGPDGALWFTQPNANSIGRMTTSGAYSQYQIPTAAAKPNGITDGPDGNIWFTETNPASGGLGYVTPSGQVHEIATTRHSFGDIVAGPDGNLWASSGLSHEVARISPSGQVTYIPISSQQPGDPAGMAAGVDGNVWFVEPNANKIGKIVLH